MRAAGVTCAVGVGRARPSARSPATWRTSPAQRQALGPLDVVHGHGPGLKRDGSVDGDRETGRRARAEAEIVGDAPAGERVHPDERELRPQAQRALETL